jgi:hypothetical protein
MKMDIDNLKKKRFIHFFYKVSVEDELADNYLVEIYRNKKSWYILILWKITLLKNFKYMKNQIIFSFDNRN